MITFFLQNKRIFAILILVFGIKFNIESQPAFNKISPELKSIILKKSQEEPVHAWIFFTHKSANTDPQLPPNAIERRSKKFSKETSLITFYDYPINQEFIDLITPFCIKIRHQSRWLNAVSVEISLSSIPKIATFDFVSRIDIVGKYKKTFHQDLTFLEPIMEPKSKNLDYGASWAQNQQIGVPFLHNLGYTGQNKIICMMDAGYSNLLHPSLQHLTILGTYDFVNGDSIVTDQNDQGSGMHGTLTLSTLAGFSNGNLIGPAYNASFVLTKTENTDSETQVEEDNWIAALEWAETNFGPDITSTSLGYREYDNGFAYTNEQLNGNTAPITLASDIAASLGILVVNSAGNSGPSPTSISAPADGDSVLAVGAVYENNDIADFSSRGPTGDGRIKPDVVAMGVGTVSASPYDQNFTYANGTSLSCPLVAGVAALLWEAFPNITNMQLYNALKNTASHSVAPNNHYGWGIVNAKAAYRYLSGIPHIAHIPLTNQTTQQTEFPVDCEIFSFNTHSFSNPTLTYRINGGNWTNEPMTISNNRCSGQISGIQQNSVVDYYISIQSNGQTYALPDDAPQNYFSFTVDLVGIVHESHSPIIIYPNPVSSKITVSIPAEYRFSNLSITNSLGVKIRTLQLVDLETLINLENLTPGIYLIEMQTGRSRFTQIFLKK
ncbi:MAG TPA: S8 family serine peptidase [Salinivirgaceae bacterium]|nr:S8 family serine peptidase [Salinivirgaceae bacterium]